MKDEGRRIEADTETETETDTDTETQIERGLDNDKCQYPSSNESLELLVWVLRQADGTGPERGAAGLLRSHAHTMYTSYRYVMCYLLFVVGFWSLFAFYLLFTVLDGTK